MTTPEQINRYQIKRELARGGMATVYEAYDPQFQRPVAIKLLPVAFLHDPEFRARFIREARTIALLEHPAIVPVYDFGEENDQPFLVMRLMTGGSLTDRLAAGPLSAEEAVEVLKRVGSALDRAHRSGIVHRDLKPGNILFDEEGQAYLADFGIARLTSSDSQLTASGSLVGTPTYMSPEQVYGNKEIDGRSDIYALGIILYQMLTGEIPFDGDTPARMMMAHVMEPVPSLSIKRPDLAVYEPIINQALAKEREDRFPSAIDMSNRLAEVTQEVKSPRVATDSAITTFSTTDADAPTITPSAFDPPVDRSSDLPPVVAHKTPTWVWGLFGLVLLVCIGGVIGTGLLVRQFAANFFLESTPTAQVADLPTSTPTKDDKATTTPSPTNTPSPTTAVVESTAEGQSQTNEETGGLTDADLLATRQSLQATRESNIQEEDPAQSLFGELDMAKAIYSQGQGDIPHTSESTIELVYPGIEKKDFVLHNTFTNPYGAEVGRWDFGVLFRQEEPNDEFRLIVHSDGLWEFVNRDDGEDDYLLEGDLSPWLRTDVNENNSITVIAVDETGYFFLNEQFISLLDLSERDNAGHLAIGVGFYTLNKQDGFVTAYENFGVWDLTAVAEPKSGELPHLMNDLIQLEPSGVTLRNFIATAVFESPFDTDVSNWDVGFSFRDDDDGTKFWLVLDSAGAWEFVGRYGSAESDVTLQSGPLSHLNTADGDENELTLITIGDTAYFFLNGRYIDQLYLSDIDDAGDIEILTAFYFDHEVEGEATRYEDFTIWPLP